MTVPTAALWFAERGSEPCETCGHTDGQHPWQEGDCILPHRGHSRTLLKPTHVCRACITRHQTQLTECLNLYATLGDVLEPGSIPDDTADHKHTKKAADVPPLVRLEVFAMLFDTGRLYTTGRGSDLPDVPAVLTAWARNTCDDQGLTGASLDSTLSTAVKLLHEHAEYIAGRPWVDEYDAELGWCRQALRRAHGISDGRQPVGRCPSLNGAGAECGGPLWPDPFGAMAVQCGACHRHFDERFLRLLGGMMTG